MSTMPDHLRPITIEIPVTWTPEQALAVWEMLDELREKIWTRYGSVANIGGRPWITREREQRASQAVTWNSPAMNFA